MQQESLIETRWREELQVVADELDVETLGVTDKEPNGERNCFTGVCMNTSVQTHACACTGF